MTEYETGKRWEKVKISIERWQEKSSQPHRHQTNQFVHQPTDKSIYLKSKTNVRINDLDQSFIRPVRQEWINTYMIHTVYNLFKIYGKNQHYEINNYWQWFKMNMSTLTQYTFIYICNYCH